MSNGVAHTSERESSSTSRTLLHGYMSLGVAHKATPLIKSSPVACDFTHNFAVVASLWFKKVVANLSFQKIIVLFQVFA